MKKNELLIKEINKLFNSAATTKAGKPNKNFWHRNPVAIVLKANLIKSGHWRKRAKKFF